MSEEEKVIIIDNGSHSTKTGFSGNKEPHSVFNTEIGRSKYQAHVSGGKFKNYYVGNEAQQLAGVLDFTYPITHGIITKIDDMEKIWHHIFYNELKIDPSEHSVLLAEPFMNPLTNSESIVTSMFEHFNVPSLNISNQCTLSLYSTGRKTGVVVDVGDEVIEIAPYYDSYLIQPGIIRMNYGGNVVTNLLQKLLMYKGYYLTKTNEKHILCDFKEKHSYVSLQYEKDFKKSNESLYFNFQYKLNDGNTLDISNEHFRCNEILFRPYKYFFRI